MPGIKILFVSLLAMGLYGGARPPGDKGFAVVELFTSEGCSSCPPADELLTAIRKEYRDNVYVLGFHVDYWDKLGWKDVYSNKDYTARQGQYAQVFALNSIYTPQIVVNGKKEFVGSDGSRLRGTIDTELKNSVNREIAVHAIRGAGNNINVFYKLKQPPGTTLQLALVQLQAASRVLAGENTGRSLVHVNVVRDFKTVSGDKADSGAAGLRMPPGLTEKDCKVIWFIQDKTDLHIIGAGEVSLERGMLKEGYHAF
jgi:hypothetical protein